MATEQEIKRAIGFMKRLARLMQKEAPKDDRLTDYATMIVERGFTRVLDEAAIRTMAAKRSFFPDPREMIEDLGEIRKNRDRAKSQQDRYGTTERTPERVAWAKKVLAQPHRFNGDANRVAKTVLTPEESGATLGDIQRKYATAWHAITDEVLRTLAEDIDKAAAGLQESDRPHFRGLVTEEVRTLCSPLAQAVAQGRERPSMDYARLDLAALARRTESQLHSTAGYEGRKNLSWWERRYGGQVAAVEQVQLKPAPEMVWSNPNARRWDNPNK